MSDTKTPSYRVESSKRTSISQFDGTCHGKGEKMVQVSVVIRARDEEQHLSDVLKMLREQTVPPSEVIVVNNYSSDARLVSFEDNMKKSGELFKRKKIRVRLASFPDRDFSHPYSTNVGIFFAENELVAITNAHALPASCSWLGFGLRHFLDRKVACVTGYSYPFEKNTPLSKVSQYVYYFSERFVLRFNWTSTVDCIIRKSLWQAYPFDENLPKVIPEAKAYGCEDYDWSKEMKARGFKTVVDPQFSVFHSHERGFEEARRNMANYLAQRPILHDIDRFKRPRRSFTRLEQMKKPDLRLMEL
jgi:GT2 family glycosyltransferase